MKTLSCIICSKPCVDHSHGQHRRYCSKRCRRKAMIDKRCSTCGKGGLELVTGMTTEGVCVRRCVECEAKLQARYDWCFACADLPWRRVDANGKPGPCRGCGQPFAPERLDSVDSYAERRVGDSNTAAAAGW